MGYTQISILDDEKQVLDQRKREYEVVVKRDVTWGEYLLLNTGGVPEKKEVVVDKGGVDG